MLVAWYISIAVRAILGVRLIGTGVWRRYPGFTAYVALSVARSVALSLAGIHSREYMLIWIAGEPILMLSLTFATLEMFWRSIAAYPGRRNAFSLIFAGAAVFALTAATVSVQIDAPLAHSGLEAVRVAKRALVSVLFLLAAAITCWMLAFPIGERPNMRLHRWVLVLYLGKEALSLLAFNTGSARDAMALANIAIGIGCYAAWMRMSPAGESVWLRPVEAGEEAQLRVRQAEIDDLLGRDPLHPERHH